MKRKICTKDRLFVEGETCPLCGGSQFTESFSGRVFIVNAEKSVIAKKMAVAKEGEYAIKIK